MLAAGAAAHSAFGGLSADLRAGLEADDEWRSRFQREEQRAAQAFRKHLRMLNSPRNCRTAPLYVFTPYAFRSGIGSVLRALANALLQASAAGRTFVVDSSVYTNHFVSPLRCPERGHECLFRPVSTCTLADAFPEAATGGGGGERDGIGRVAAHRPAGYSHDRPQQEHEYGPRVVATRTSCFKTASQELEFTPREHSALAAEHLGARWYITQAMAYLTRPNEALQLVTVHLAKTLSLDATSRYVSVHIRRGDKGSEAALHPTEAYADVIRNISAERHIDRVLLASDDRQVHEELPALLPDRFRVDWVPFAAWAHAARRTSSCAAAAAVTSWRTSMLRRRRRPRTPRPPRGSATTRRPLTRGSCCSRRLSSLPPARSSWHVDLKLRSPRVRPRCGAEAGAWPDFYDLDGNEPYPCHAREKAPYGPQYGQPVRRGPQSRSESQVTYVF